MQRQLLVVALVILLMLAVSEASFVCKRNDCSDVLGEPYVRSNLGKSVQFTQRHFDDWKEESRVRRIEIQHREREEK